MIEIAQCSNVDEFPTSHRQKTVSCGQVPISGADQRADGDDGSGWHPHPICADAHWPY